jgi:hypothetical protein
MQNLGKIISFSCILDYIGVKVVINLIYAGRPETLISIGVCLVKMHYFCLQHYLKRIAHAQLTSIQIVNSCHISLFLYLYHSWWPSGQNIYIPSYDINDFFSMFLKVLLHEIFVCFTWPIYTDLYCSSRCCLIF